MAFLIDTNVLVRLANSTDAQHPDAARAVLELHRRGEELHITRQNLIEPFNFAHFNRMAGFGPGIVVVDPATI